MPFLLAQIAPESFLIGGWQAEKGSASSSTASARRGDARQQCRLFARESMAGT
jgi:hypothetical protein